MNWREEYEFHADGERSTVDSLSVERLLEDVRARRFGDYYSLWKSIADRATIDAAGWILFDVLMDRSVDYLQRYHCAAALLSLLGVKTLQPVQLSATGHPDTSSNLERVRALLELRIGPA